MKIKFLFPVLFAFGFYAHAQNQVDFEDVNLGASGFYNGSNLAGGFTSGGLYFYNTFDSQFQSWNGFACSNKSDTLTAGFSNQYSCYAGSGGDGSANFGLAYIFGPAILRKSDGGSFRVNSFQFTNATFSGLSMKNGDAFSKKFGGPSGNDPDFFRMRVYNHFQGQVNDSAEFYLADYRFADNAQDYIVKSWRTANLNFSSLTDSLSFTLESSDNGTFGMNTPAYFCIDNIQYQTFVSNSGLHGGVKTEAFPNPFQEKLVISGSEKPLVYDLNGHIWQVPGKSIEQNYVLDTRNLAAGIYVLRFPGGEFLKVVKN
jgi:hypothetical protein